MRYDTVHERSRGVGVGTLQQEAMAMAMEPSVERLHADEVRHDDVLVGHMWSSQNEFTT
jgi:hypothetical protein